MSVWELKLTQFGGTQLHRDNKFIELNKTEARNLLGVYQSKGEAEAEKYAQKLWDATKTHHDAGRVIERKNYNV